MNQAKIARRNALRAIAGSALALPLLQTFRGFNSASAQPTSYPKRLIIYATNNSGWPEQFWPTLAGQTPIPLRPPEGYYVSGLDPLDATDFSFSPILKPLEKHRKNLIIAEGIDGFEGGHEGYHNLLSGVPTTSGDGGGGATLDHIIAQELGLAQATKFANLQLGVKTDAAEEPDPIDRLSWYGADKAAPGEGDPAKVYDRVFANFTAPSGAPSQAPDPAVVRRKSVLDASAQQLLDLQARLPFKEDREKLEAHLTSLRAVEELVGRGNGVGAVAGCAKPTPSSLDPLLEANAPLVAQAQMENLLLAMSCDLTRVATFEFYYQANNFGHSWLGINATHHNQLGHGEASDMALQEQILKIETWQSGQVSYLLDRLASIPEGAGTMLDNTVVLFMQTHTRGHVHSNQNLPVVIAGNWSGNALRQGRYLRFSRTPAGSGRLIGSKDDPTARIPLGVARTTSDLCFSLMQGMGANPSTFGDPTRFTGGIPEIKA